MQRMIAHWLADPAIFTAYMVFALAVLIVPMIMLSLWYHKSVRRSAGGRALMNEQNAEPPLAHAAFLSRNFTTAARLHRRISSGVFGKQVQNLQNRVYWLTGLWVLANVIVFGILIWAGPVKQAATTNG